MTNQEAYERMREYFTRPGAQLAKREGGTSCYYRHPDDGRACAVGCLIPDELYFDALDSYIGGVEGWGASDGWEGLSEIIEHLSLWAEDGTYEFLSEAQSAHDNSDDTEEFVSALDAIAHEHNLQVAA